MGSRSFSGYCLPSGAATPSEVVGATPDSVQQQRHPGRGSTTVFAVAGAAAAVQCSCGGIFDDSCPMQIHPFGADVSEDREGWRPQGLFRDSKMGPLLRLHHWRRLCYFHQLRFEFCSAGERHWAI